MHRNEYNKWPQLKVAYTLHFFNFKFNLITNKKKRKDMSSQGIHAHWLPGELRLTASLTSHIFHFLFYKIVYSLWLSHPCPFNPHHIFPRESVSFTTAHKTTEHCVVCLNTRHGRLLLVGDSADTQLQLSDVRYSVQVSENHSGCRHHNLGCHKIQGCYFHSTG